MDITKRHITASLQLMFERLDSSDLNFSESARQTSVSRMQTQISTIQTIRLTYLPLDLFGSSSYNTRSIILLSSLSA